VTGIQGPSAWDPIVLQQAKYDFVEMHFYPETSGQEDDTFLLTQAPQQFAQSLNRVRQELAAAGRPDTPIMVGEFNSVSNDVGKQSVSIVNSLYMGMALGEMLRAGVQLATMQEGFTSCGTGNQSPSLYGWQNFGSYNLFSDGLPTRRAVPGCPNAQPTPFGTPFPNARAYQLATLFAQPSEHMLSTSVTEAPSVRAYAATQGSGYVLLLFNLDKDNPVTISVNIANRPRSSFTGQISVYDRAIYDQSQNNIWAGPTSSSMGPLTNPFSITLTPWSMTVLQLTAGQLTPSPRDFNADGISDILWRHSSGVVYEWLLNGASIIGAGSPGTASTDWRIVGVGDFNGDGKADVLWRHSSGAVYEWLRSEERRVGVVSPASGASDWTVAGVGDFNGDGKADILWRHTSGAVYVSLMDGGIILGAGSPGSASTDWSIVGVGDFNGDGKADVLWRHSSGVVYEWLLNGTNIIGAGSPGSASTDWSIVGVGDFN